MLLLHILFLLNAFGVNILIYYHYKKYQLFWTAVPHIKNCVMLDAVNSFKY